MKTRRSSVLTIGALCGFALSAAGPGIATAQEPAAADARAADEPDGVQHYRLKRRVIRVSLDRNPLVRVQCTVRDRHGISETLVWDPEERRGLVRYALLPKNPDKPEIAVSCVSDRLDLGTHGAFAYVFPRGETRIVAPWTNITDGSPVGATERQRGQLALTVVAEPVIPVQKGREAPTESEHKYVLDQLGGFEGTSNLRSLDPTTLVDDLLGALATIALDRASEAGKQYARRFLKRYLCDALTVGKMKAGLADSPLANSLTLIKWPDERHLLQTTCTMLDTARIDELASARDAVWRAVAVDATDLAGAILNSAFERQPRLKRIVLSATDLMKAVVAGNTATTERDVQVLILGLGRIGLSAAPDGWQCGIEAGVAILRDCLRDQQCSADELQRLIEQEARLASEDATCNVREAFASWPELPTLLGRVADVLRPSPGVDARMTAATALELVLDVAEHVITRQAFAGDFARRNRDSYTLAMIRALRAVTAAMRGEDPSTVVLELAAVLKVAIVEYCSDTKRVVCSVPIETHTLHRAFAVVTALASYGASYRDPGPGDQSSVELQKVRAEQRRKALETIIDAFTDRSQRGGEWIVSVGANARVGAQAIVPLGDGDATFNYNALSLPMGLAVQRLRTRTTTGSLHFMVSFADLAQYLTVPRDDGAPDVPDPSLTTSLRLGVEAGVSLGGTNSLPILLSIDYAWIPRVAYEADQQRSEHRFGVSVGVYVPFFDLN